MEFIMCLIVGNMIYLFTGCMILRKIVIDRGEDVTLSGLFVSILIWPIVVPLLKIKL